MFDRNEQRFSKPLLWLLRAIGVIVLRWLRVDWRQGWEAEFGLAPSCVAESSQMFRDEAQAISKRTEINDFDKLPVKIKALRLLP